MLFLVLIFALLVALILYQSLHGLFSSLLMLVLTLSCTAFAFGMHEWVAYNWISKWRPQYAYAISLAACFGVPLIVLRLLFDRFIRRAPLLPAIVDRVGGGICAVITAFTLSGVLAIALQMIPFEYGLFGFSRIPPVIEEDSDNITLKITPPKLDRKQQELWLSPDRFAVGMASLLSDGIFSGERSFVADNPDYVSVVGWVNSTREDVARFSQKNGIRVIESGTVSEIYEYKKPLSRRGGQTSAEWTPIQPKAQHRFVVVRVGFDRDAVKDQWQRVTFTLRQFRVVGQRKHRSDKEQYHAIALNSGDEQFPERHVAYRTTRHGAWPIVDDVLWPKSEFDNGNIEIVFELPEDFQPEYIAFRHGAYAPFRFTEEEDKSNSRPRSSSRSSTSATETASTAPSTAVGQPASNSGRGGRVRAFTTLSGTSFFGEDMPMVLKDYEALRNAEVNRDALANGHLVGMVDDQDKGTKAAVRKFEVPSDKRLLQLNITHLEAKSLLGRAVTKAVTTVQNYSVLADNGTRYQVVGKYATAMVNGKQVIEVQYFKNQAGSIGGITQFSKIKDRHLRKDAQIFFLFLVDPGVKVIQFSTGGRANRADDLESENLVAPE